MILNNDKYLRKCELSTKPREVPTYEARLDPLPTGGLCLLVGVGVLAGLLWEPQVEGRT